ncbi:phophatidylserine decarboxylase associated domain-containing protein [Caldimonas tepidiphila]|uniref:phophatidylserine decarboxylase associated domain-containing protein n=1 Tax=Caldimonas tepidiphila TaxID=2315841 RepID=UPI00196A9191|nr:phophatidylserine decarboxylase associated domain-containing protein [Caldimonas tepidiphila]
MTQTIEAAAPFRVGHWLPSDHRILQSWLQARIDELDEAPEPLHPAVEELAQLIERDPQIHMLFHQMFSQVPHKPPYNRDPTGQPQVRDPRQMLRLVNAVMNRAPEFNKSGLVGFPINAILDWAMGTSSGFAAFLNAEVNRALKRILNEWGRFLASPDSRYVLNADPHQG